MRRLQKGFTLIEMMFVAAIVGMLGAIAVHSYSEFQARSKVAASLVEISAGKVIVDILLNEGRTLSTPSDVGLPNSSGNCVISVNFTGTDGAGSIECVLTHTMPEIAGKRVSWERSSAGVWSCISTVGEKYLPKTCKSV